MYVLEMSQYLFFVLHLYDRNTLLQINLSFIMQFSHILYIKRIFQI